MIDEGATARRWSPGTTQSHYVTSNDGCGGQTQAESSSSSSAPPVPPRVPHTLWNIFWCSAHSTSQHPPGINQAWHHAVFPLHRGDGWGAEWCFFVGDYGLSVMSRIILIKGLQGTPLVVSLPGPRPQTLFLLSGFAVSFFCPHCIQFSDRSHCQWGRQWIALCLQLATRPDSLDSSHIWRQETETSWC